jgi:hypothetical protein
MCLDESFAGADAYSVEVLQPTLVALELRWEAGAKPALPPQL